MTNSHSPLLPLSWVSASRASTSPEKLEYGTEDCAACGREAVKSVLRLFDELVKCDEEGILKGVREVIAITNT